MTTRPGYIWSGTEWVSIGQEAVVAPVSYQTSAPSTPSTGDIWIDSNDDVPGIDTSQFLRWRKTMSGGETSVSGTDDNGLTLQYTANYEQVYLNGVLLVRGQDYTATNGTSITGLTALAANDVVEVFGVVARVVGDVYTQAQTNSLLDAKSPVSTTGLVLLNTTDFSAVSSVSINNVFSSTYTNYKINIYFTDVSNSSTSITFKLRASGTDNSANYSNFGWTNVSGTLSSYSATGQSAGTIVNSTTGGVNYAMFMDISGPALSTRTFGTIDSYNYGYGTIHNNFVHENNSYTADGINIITGAGTITGTIKVYGYK